MDNNDTMPDLLGLIPQKPKEPGAKSPVKKKRHVKPKPADRNTDYTFANLIAQPFSHQISFQLPEKLRLDINISLNNHKNAGRFDHVDLSDVIRAALAAYFARGMPLTEISDTAPEIVAEGAQMWRSRRLDARWCMGLPNPVVGLGPCGHVLHVGP
jgi:hypothetical protein